MLEKGRKGKKSSPAAVTAVALPGQAVLAAAGRAEHQSWDICLGWMAAHSKGGSQQGRDGARGLRKSPAETLSRLLRVSELNHNSHLEYLTDIYAAYINSAVVPTKALQLSIKQVFS